MRPVSSRFVGVSIENSLIPAAQKKTNLSQIPLEAIARSGYNVAHAYSPELRLRAGEWEQGSRRTVVGKVNQPEKKPRIFRGLNIRDRGCD